MTQWKKATENYIPSYRLGNDLKVVQYGDYWFAYYKPEGWKNFGNSIEHSTFGSKRYSTKEQAMKVCENYSKETK